MQNPEWKKRLLGTKNLKEVWRKSKTDLVDTWNLGILFSAAVAWLIYTIVLEVNYIDNYAQYVALLRYVTKTAITIFPNILGFFVAGLAILVAIPDRDLFKLLAQTQEKTDSDMTKFQSIFFDFLKYFVHLLAFLGASVVIGIIFENTSASSTQKAAIDVFFTLLEASIIAKNIILNLTALLFILWLIHIFWKSKSFIWNIYVLISLYVADPLEPFRKEESDSSTDSGSKKEDRSK